MSGKNTFFKFGLPMIAFTLVGLYSVTEFMKNHYEIKDRRNSSITERQFDLKKEHEKMMKSLDIDNYSLSKIPRPEEEPEKKPSLKPLDLLADILDEIMDDD